MLDGLYKADDGAALRFYWDTAKNNAQSERLNRSIHDEVLYVEIISPGSRESSPVYEVIRKFNSETGLEDQLNPVMHERYKEQIEAFLKKESGSDVTGTPLTEFTAVDRATVASLHEARIYTVEALAALPDEKLRVLGMEGRTLRSRAQAFLDDAKSGEAVAKLASEVEDLKEQLSEVEQRAVAAENRVKELEAASQKQEATPTPPPAKKGTKSVENNPGDGDSII